MSEQGTKRSHISFASVVLFVDIAADVLADAREEINALNVYPVPDGDTGTNMFLTVSAARDALSAAIADGSDEATCLAAFARGALLGARGNSGVILSQMLVALVRRIAAAPADERSAVTLAQALREGTDASYAAVGTPVEGTMLTVARAASDAALATSRDASARSGDVFAAAAEAARVALARTPEQLEVLSHAGVVDAGGRGISLILDSAESALTGRVLRHQSKRPGVASAPIPRPALPTNDLHEGGPAYEVMYLLDAEDDAVRRLRTALAGLGDSLVVVGGDGLWNVHVHVDDVGAAIEAGIEAGRPHRVRVTHFADQVAGRTGQGAHAGGQRRRMPVSEGRAVVAVAAGPGLVELFGGSGARVLTGGPGRRASAGELLEEILAAGTAEVIVLPNDKDTVRAAQVAARTAEEDHGVRVAVIPTGAQVQGLAALAVHEPGRTFDSDVLGMTAAASHVRDGAVTIAAREAFTSAGPCQPGDALGIIAGDFVVVGDDLGECAIAVLDRLLGSGGELLTLVTGDAAESADLARQCAEHVAERWPHVEVVDYVGGQQRYPLLVSVE